MSASRPTFRRFGRLLAASTAAATVLASVTVTAGAAESDHVTFSVTNITDFHGHLEENTRNRELGAAKMASVIKKVNEDQEYILTTSGDDVGGTPFISAITDDEYTLRVLREMGVQVAAVGNHEFDKGVDDLVNRIIPKQKSTYPILGANVLRNGNPIPELPPTHVITTESGVKVGFVGTVTRNTAIKVSPAAIEGVVFTDEVAATNKWASELKKTGAADIVIALTHEDAELIAAGVNTDVDVVFGGDTHLPRKGEIARDGARPLLYAQGHEYSKIVNDLDITFDTATREVVSMTLNQYDHAWATANSIEPDATIAQTVAEAKEASAEAGAKQVAVLEQATYRGSEPGQDSGSNRGVESTLNNLIAEAQRVGMSEQVGRSIDIGVMNAGGVRADLPAGPVTFQQVFQVQPFGNSVGYGEITGANFIKALEQQWKPGEARPRLAMGVSNNVQVIYDPTAEFRSRIRSVTIDGKPIDPAATYTIAMSTFLAVGGDGFFVDSSVEGSKPSLLSNFTDVGNPDTEIFGNYLAGKPEIRSGQGQVGVAIDGEIAAGKEITVNLSSLSYSTAGEPEATTATVTLGSASASATISNEAREGDKGMGEIGRASVTLTVPADLTGEQDLVITTDAGTSATLKVNVGGDNSPAVPTPEANPVAGIVGLIALIGTILALLGLGPNLLPAPLSSFFANIAGFFGKK